jgi:hypothetical protein
VPQRELCRGARLWKLLALAGAAGTPVRLLAGISYISHRVGRTPRGIARNTVGVLRFLLAMAPLVGGESIHVIFRKERLQRNEYASVRSSNIRRS